jgi:hypothetical protein
VTGHHAYGEARAWATHRATVLQAEWRRARTRTGGALLVVLPDAPHRSLAAPRLADAAAARDRVHAALPLLRRRDPDAVPRVAATVQGCTRLVGDLARAVLTLERTGPHAGAPALGPLLAVLDRAVAALRSLDASVARVVTDDHTPGAGSPWDGGVARSRRSSQA